MGDLKLVEELFTYDMFDDVKLFVELSTNLYKSDDMFESLLKIFASVGEHEGWELMACMKPIRASESDKGRGPLIQKTSELPNPNKGVLWYIPHIVINSDKTKNAFDVCRVVRDTGNDEFHRIVRTQRNRLESMDSDSILQFMQHLAWGEYLDFHELVTELLTIERVLEDTTSSKNTQLKTACMYRLRVFCDGGVADQFTYLEESADIQKAGAGRLTKLQLNKGVDWYIPRQIIE